MKRAAALIALSLCLVACEQQAGAPAEEGGAASGEVLPGAVSDAMIPLEQVESQAPLAPRQAQAVGEDIDAEQPEVDPVPGIDGAVPAAEGAEAAPAAPAPDQSQL